MSAAIITITGTPTATPGIYPVTVRVYKNTNYGSDVAAQIFNICVLGFSAQPTATPASISSGQTSTLTCTAAGNPAAIPIVGSGPPAAQPAGTLTYQWYRGTKPDTSNPVGTTNSPSPDSPRRRPDRHHQLLGENQVRTGHQHGYRRLQHGGRHGHCRQQSI